MPDIKHYIDRVNGAHFFDDHDLVMLQLVYDRLRRYFFADDNDPRRETLATMIFQATEQTKNPDELFRNVVAHYEGRS